MTKEKYLKLVMKNLNCSMKEKRRIASDLKSDIDTSLENGESFESIQVRLGSPLDIAREFNENLAPYKKSKKKLILIIVFIVCLIFGGLYLGIKSLFPKMMTIEESGIFDESMLINQSEQVIKNLAKEDKTDLYAMFDAKMKQSTDDAMLEEAVQTLGELGDYQRITHSQFVCMEKDEWLAVGEVVALYKERSVTYTITFNEDLQVEGLYMK